MIVYNGVGSSQKFSRFKKAQIKKLKFNLKDLKMISLFKRKESD